MATRFLFGAVAFATLAWSIEATAFEVTRVSVGNDGNQANGRSRNAAVSGDGRYVAFSTRATNLSAEDTDTRLDLYERDRDSGKTTLISRSINVLETNGDSDRPDYDASGNRLVFQSNASNLVREDEAQSDIFLFERKTGQTLILTRATDGDQPNGGSNSPQITADGNAVVFASNASNLIDDDTNGVQDIFVHFLQLGETRRVSLTSDGREPDGGSFDPSISDDARFVAFTSRAPNLTGLGGELSRVFVRDLLTGKTTMVGGDLADRLPSDIHDQPRLSADGGHLAFRRVRNGGAGNQTLFLADLSAGTVTNITPRDLGTVFNLGDVSADGSQVLFDTASDEIIPGDNNNAADVFLYDAETGKSRRVSGPGPNAGGNAESRALELSPDGRFALFFSAASNLVAGDTNGTEDIFLNDLLEFAITTAITGSWFDPAQDGQGFIIEVLDGNRLLFYWFTFQPNGGRDWILGVLDVNGTVAEGDAIQVSGGRFPPNFDPRDIDQLDWGTVRFEFSGCDSGKVIWDSSRPGYGSGEFPIERLTRIPGLDCP